MNRPDQEKFDRFSNAFIPIDEPLQKFAAENALDYFQDPKRLPSRELHSRGNPILMFGVWVEANWHLTEYNEGLRYGAGATGIVWPTRVLITKYDERLIRQLVLREHQTIPMIQDELEGLLNEWKQLVSSWQVPDLSSSDGVFERLGWETGANWRGRKWAKSRIEET